TPMRRGTILAAALLAVVALLGWLAPGRLASDVRAEDKPGAQTAPGSRATLKRCGSELPSRDSQHSPGNYRDHRHHLHRRYPVAVGNDRGALARKPTPTVAPSPRYCATHSADAVTVNRPLMADVASTSTSQPLSSAGAKGALWITDNFLRSSGSAVSI